MIWSDSGLIARQHLGFFNRRGIVDAETVEKKNKTPFKTRSHVRLHSCTAAEMELHCTVCHCPSRLQVTSPVHWLCVVRTQVICSLTLCHLLDLLLTSRWDDLPKDQFSFSCCSQEDSNYVAFWGMCGSCFFLFVCFLIPANIRPIKMCPNQQLAASATCINACCSM